MLKNVLNQLFVARTRDEASRANRGTLVASRKRRAADRHVLAGESLERRSMLAVTARLWANGELRIDSDSASDRVALNLSNDNQRLEVQNPGELTRSFALGLFTSVTVSGTGQQPLTFQGPHPLRLPLWFIVQNMSSVTIDQRIENTGNVRFLRIGTAGIQINADIATAGDALQFDGNVTLGAGPTITLATSSAPGSRLTLAGTLAGEGSSLAVTGNAVIGGAVSGVANLSVSGTTTINTPSITTSGGQTYTGAVTLGANTTLTGTIPTFGNGIVGDNTKNLTLNFSGTTAIDGGTFTGIADLATGNGGLTTLMGSLATTGSQTFGDAVTLLSDTVATSTGSNNAIEFSSTVDGDKSLRVNTFGATTFGGTVGGVTSLTSLTTNTGGTVSLQSVTTSDGQDYNDNATLNGTYMCTGSRFLVGGTASLAGNTEITVGSSGTIDFRGTVNGAFNLTANSTGSTAFFGVVGGRTPLASLTTNAGGTVTFRRSVTTSGVQSYGEDATLEGTYATTNSAFSVAGATTLSTDATVSTGTGVITFSGTVNGAKNLTVNSTGATLFGAAVGGVTSLTSLTTNAGGTVSLQSVTTTGAQQYGEAATLAGTYATTNNAFSVASTTTLAGSTAVSTGSGGISFTGAVDGPFSLTANSTGATLFSAAVGGVTSLTSLTTNTGGTVSLQSVTTTGAQQYGEAATLIGTYTTTNSAFSVTGTTTLAGSTTVMTGGGDIRFTGLVDGRKNLTLDAGSGTAAFASAVGSKSPLGAIKVLSAGSFAAGGPLTLDGNFAGSGANGLEFPAGIDALSLTNGGTISGFSGDGILFGGNVTNSTVKNFKIQNNGGNGINLPGSDLTGTVIAANTITGNGQSGIRVAGSKVLIGGAAGGNTIASNKGDGVLITGNTAMDNSILSNSIYGNGGLGIRLADGSNEGIPAPVLTDARIIGGTSLQISGTMQSGGRPYRIQFFRNQPEDASTANGYEGRTLVRERDITDGVTSFTDTFVITDPVDALGRWYTATATFLDVGNNPLSTSEFSTGLRLSTEVVTTSADAGPGSLRQAMQAANGAPGAESIIFDIPSLTPGDLTITLVTQLPAAIGPMSIDGVNLNRPGNLAAPVSIDGQRVAGAANGLVFTATAAGSTVRSLGIAHFTRGAGIFMAAAGMDVAGNTLTNNSFGITASGGLSGSQIRGNTISQITTFGIYLASSTGLTVGSTTVGQGNTVTGGTGRQVYSTGLYATGNLAGTRVIGNTFSGNVGSGVMLVNATGITVGGTAAGSGNIITNNRAFGFYASGTSTGSSAVSNTITGNRVNISRSIARSLAFR